MGFVSIAVFSRMRLRIQVRSVGDCLALRESEPLPFDHSFRDMVLNALMNPAVAS